MVIIRLLSLVSTVLAPAAASQRRLTEIYDLIEIGTSNYGSESISFPDYDKALAVEPNPFYLQSMPDRKGLVKVNAAVLGNEKKNSKAAQYDPDSKLLKSIDRGSLLALLQSHLVNSTTSGTSQIAGSDAGNNASGERESNTAFLLSFNRFYIHELEKGETTYEKVLNAVPSCLLKEEESDKCLLHYSPGFFAGLSKVLTLGRNEMEAMSLVVDQDGEKKSRELSDACPNGSLSSSLTTDLTRLSYFYPEYIEHIKQFWEFRELLEKAGKWKGGFVCVQSLADSSAISRIKTVTELLTENNIRTTRYLKADAEGFDCKIVKAFLQAYWELNEEVFRSHYLDRADSAQEHQNLASLSRQYWERTGEPFAPEGFPPKDFYYGWCRVYKENVKDSDSKNSNSTSTNNALPYIGQGATICEPGEDSIAVRVTKKHFRFVDDDDGFNKAPNSMNTRLNFILPARIVFEHLEFSKHMKHQPELQSCLRLLQRHGYHLQFQHFDVIATILE